MSPKEKTLRDEFRIGKKKCNSKDMAQDEDAEDNNSATIWVEKLER